MNITATIGSESDERSVSVTIDDENGWSPDQMTDACNRTIAAAVVAWRELHPAPVATIDLTTQPIDAATADEIVRAVRARLLDRGML